MEEAAQQQLINTASMHFIRRHVAVMPDIHLSKGSSVGSVIPTKEACAHYFATISDVGARLEHNFVDRHVWSAQKSVKICGEEQMADADFIEELVGTIGVISVMIGMALSFNRVTKKPEYRALMDSGQKISLNLMTLLAAFLREDSDPLKAPHTKIAMIGLLYFCLMIIGIFFYLVAMVLIMRMMGI